MLVSDWSKWCQFLKTQNQNSEQRFESQKSLAMLKKLLLVTPLLAGATRFNSNVSKASLDRSPATGIFCKKYH